MHHARASKHFFEVELYCVHGLVLVARTQFSSNQVIHVRVDIFFVQTIQGLAVVERHEVRE